MNVSGIEWLQNPDGSKGLTVNPVIGCDETSPGCKNCWAKELVAMRMSRNPKLPMYHNLARITDLGKTQWTGVVKLVPERLREIVALGRRKKGSRVFVCDMSDMFHEDVPFEFIAAIFGAMACAPNHLFYVLTKRAERAVEFGLWLRRETDFAARSLGYDVTAWLYCFVCANALSDVAEKEGWCRPTVGPNAVWPLPNVVVRSFEQNCRHLKISDVQ